MISWFLFRERSRFLFFSDTCVNARILALVCVCQNTIAIVLISFKLLGFWRVSWMSWVIGTWSRDIWRSQNWNVPRFLYLRLQIPVLVFYCGNQCCSCFYLFLINTQPHRNLDWNNSEYKPFRLCPTSFIFSISKIKNFDYVIPYQILPCIT